MTALNCIAIGFIGFGEVGQRFAADLLRNQGVAIRAYDIVLDDPARRDERLARAEAIGVAPAGDARAAVTGAGVVISAVTADQTEAVAAATARLLTPGQIFLDVNSAAPNTKRRAARLVEAAGAHYVEGAVMAPVATPGIKVSILAGGPHATATAALLNGLGMNLKAVATEHGRASAMKLCRSIMIKGLETLITDCAAACREWDVEDEVFGSLAHSFPGIDWPAQAEYMAERIATHGLRRAAEMREAAEMLADLGRDPGLAHAVADAQQRGAKPKPS